MRYLASLALALVVSLSIFWGMDRLVNKEHQELKSSDDTSFVDFVRVKREDKVEEKKRELPKPKQPKRPPPPPELKVASTVKPTMDKMPMNVPSLDLPVNIAGGAVLASFGQGGGGTIKANNGPTPLATFLPQMPRKAARAGLKKGIVELEFTVNERGSVENVTVIKEEPRHLGLGRVARRTVSKWTFKPKMDEGKAIAARISQEIEFVVK
ncbi:energy transducer TonB [Vibrio tritonius]|uniref:Energy transducer TonB n=1 Tax=Vibrio tritonius TaxID=1435069 RepID=A0ABS7YHY5_9VIBR|nr:energy transducer TonB [Vibrio tritonius]MCA2014557.1 energy transducer TonB [Vibrio tritonius]